MPRYATLIRTGKRAQVDPNRLTALFQQARCLCPDGFPADETRELDALREHVSIAFVEQLRGALATQLELATHVFSLDRFTIQGAGPVSLHDDARNYPGGYFAIIVAHSGRLGVVDAHSRAVRHAPGEILLLDPRKKHALVPEGLRAAEQRCAPPNTLAREEQDQFLFLDFEVPRAALRSMFRHAG
jgi:hypothetical protein